MENSELKKINLLGVPVSNCDIEGALRALKIFLVDGRQHQVVFLDRKGLFRARHDAEYRRCLQQASLVLPVTGQLVKSAKLLKLDRIYRFYPFEFIIRLLSLTERLNLSIYLLGARKGELERAEKNLRDSFPGLSVVGRFSHQADSARRYTGRRRPRARPHTRRRATDRKSTRLNSSHTDITRMPSSA